MLDVCYAMLHFFAIWSISTSTLSIIAWKAPASSWSPSEPATFLKIDPGVLGRSVNFKIPKRFLCRRPVVLDDLSLSCDYGLISNIQIDFNPLCVKLPVFIPILIHFVNFQIFTQISTHFLKFRLCTLILSRFINFRINTSISIYVTRKLKTLRVRILRLLHLGTLDKFIFQ